MAAKKKRIASEIFEIPLEELAEKDVLELFGYILMTHGEVWAADLLENGDFEDESLHEQLLDIIKENRKRKRVIHFHDIADTRLHYYYIIGYEKGYTDDDEPTIILNKFEDSIKDNPVRNVVLVYDDIDVRDEDYEILVEKI